MSVPKSRAARPELIRLLSMMSLVMTLAAAPALAQVPERVQYLPRDGAVIVLWDLVKDATGYNLYGQEVSGRGNETLALKQINKEPIKTRPFLVENLKNGTAYHFRVSAIVNGVETDRVGPLPAQNELGQFVAVVPQKPVKLAGLDGFYGHTVGTDFPGSHEVDEKTGAVSLRASGWDIQTGGDGMYYLAVPIGGDIMVTVRTVSGPTETANQSTWNLAGPQIREDLTVGSRLAMTQVAHTGAAQFKYREEANDGTPDEKEADGDPTRRPLWLRLVRKGDEFSGFLSDDGKEWKQVGDTHTIENFAREAYVGLALSAHDDGEYSSVTFDNLAITTPP
jgi:hypothetical protein